MEWEVKLLTILIILRFIVQFDGNEKQRLCHFSKFPLDIFPIFHTFILHFALCSLDPMSASAFRKLEFRVQWNDLRTSLLWLDGNFFPFKTFMI